MINIYKNKKALFLDRDGILNYLVDNRPPWLISEIKIYNEAFEILKIAKESFYLPVVITNQPDAGRGKLSYQKLNLIHERIMKTYQEIRYSNFQFYSIRFYNYVCTISPCIRLD